MIIIANTLNFNGGTTFIARYCKEASTQGNRIGVFVLASGGDPELIKEINKYADVYYLDAFIAAFFKIFSTTPLYSFLPIKWKKLSCVFEQYGNNFHVMGLFGLLFLARYSSVSQTSIKFSVGIYHQNEFMYRHVNYYFSNIAKDFFKKLDINSIVFFNNFNKRVYAKFFDNDYAKSIVVPIGIETPSRNDRVGNNYPTKKIISVGSLNEFKTYNRHVIALMPELIKIDNSFSYVIYGNGSSENSLKRLACKLGVENHVFFKGSIAYSQLKSVLSDAFLFVGSGTAIIEASSIGIPSIIGIESSKTADTYGFFYDTFGYSYNEIDTNREITSYISLIEMLNNNSIFWEQTSQACYDKAKEFSMAVTYVGLNELNSKLAVTQPSFFKSYSNYQALISLALCAVNHSFFGKKVFALRRNQGTLT